LKLNGTNQHLLYADCVNIVGESVHNVKENEEALLVASKETGLDVNADKTKYMVLSRDQKARRSHSMKNENRPFGRVEEFKLLRTASTNQNSTQ
jgi:hypothetical protein